MIYVLSIMFLLKLGAVYFLLRKSNKLAVPSRGHFWPMKILSHVEPILSMASLGWTKELPKAASSMVTFKRYNHFVAEG